MDDELQLNYRTIANFNGIFFKERIIITGTHIPSKPKKSMLKGRYPDSLDGGPAGI